MCMIPEPEKVCVHANKPLTKLISIASSLVRQRKPIKSSDDCQQNRQMNGPKTAMQMSAYG
jgi:hypothetical protein